MHPKQQNFLFRTILFLFQLFCTTKICELFWIEWAKSFKLTTRISKDKHRKHIETSSVAAVLSVNYSALDYLCIQVPGCRIVSVSFDCVFCWCYIISVTSWRIISDSFPRHPFHFIEETKINSLLLVWIS